MSAIDSFTAAKARGLGFMLSALNPKNLGLTIAAMSIVSSAGLSTGEEIGSLAVFVILASLTVAAPVVINMVMGSEGDQHAELDEGVAHGEQQRRDDRPVHRARRQAVRRRPCRRRLKAAAVLPKSDSD
jgi:hypothetical protein